MLIGEDFEKIKLHLFGLDLLEPNAFIGDLIIFIVAIYFAYKTNKHSAHGLFFVYWKWLFIVFGTGFLLGGFGHLLYNYTGVPGKYPSWYSGILCSYLVEVSFISIFPNITWRKPLKLISITKMVVATIMATYFFYTTDITIDPQKGLMIPTVNSIIGLGITFLILGFYYQRKIDHSFRYFMVSVLLLVPSAVFQSMKINIAQWFDRNDVSHVLLISSLIFYFIGVQSYQKSLTLGPKDPS